MSHVTHLVYQDDTLLFRPSDKLVLITTNKRRQSTWTMKSNDFDRPLS